MDRADIVISGTGASTYVLLPEDVKPAMKKRGGQPMFLVDIAVPRDIDPRIADIAGAYVYDIDDLQQVVQGNQKHREREAEQAKVLIEEDARAFLSWLKSLESVPLIRGIQQQVEKARLEEMEKARRYLKGLTPEQEAAVERLSKALMKRFTHPALQTLKTLPDDMEGDLLMGAASRLFAAKLVHEQRNITTTREPDEHASG